MANDRPIKLSFSLGFQVKYCLVLVVIFIIANGLLYLLLNKALGGGYLQSLQTLYYLDQHLPMYLSIMGLLLMLFILVLTLVVTLLVSHQIAGPVFRYEDVMQKIISGVFSQKVATRQSDQLKPLVSSLNAMTSRCRDTYAGAQRLSGLVEAHLVREPETEKLNTLLQQVTEVRQQMGAYRSERDAE
ncbi:MAG: hypothetical protein KAI39_09775 [Desulfobulbaceae bacterium]|nr:hypothetical protein [Desulfobulbaceae bacterium]